MSDRPESPNQSRRPSTGSSSGLNDDVWAYILTGNRNAATPTRYDETSTYRQTNPGPTTYIEPTARRPRHNQNHDQNQGWAGTPGYDQSLPPRTRYDQNQNQDWSGNPRFREPQVYQQHADRYRGRRPGDSGGYDQGYADGYRDAMARMQQGNNRRFESEFDPRAYAGTYREREMARHPERYRRRESAGIPGDAAIRRGRGPGMTDSEFQAWRNGDLSVPPRSSVYDQYDQYPNSGISYEQYRRRNGNHSARELAMRGIEPPNYREDRYGRRFPADGYADTYRNQQRYADHERDQYGRDRYGRNAPYDGQNNDWAAMRDVIGQMIGRPIYHFDRSIDPNLGCARFVSFTLEKSLGLPIRDASVAGLERSLQRNGYEAIPLDQAQAGDVIIGHRHSGRKGHAAIKAAGDATVANSSVYGVIRPNTVSAFYGSDYSRVVAYRRVYA